MNRREFVVGGIAAAAFPQVLAEMSEGAVAKGRYDLIQKEIDQVRGADFRAYREAFEPGMLDRFAALRRLEETFDQVVREVRETTVTDRPAVWLVYNMGIVVKTPKACFSVDLMHRRGHELAKTLDFALVTHNHNDHYTTDFVRTMDRVERKTIISNFLDNYGVADWKRDGGYTRAQKTFRIRDVEIRTGLTDHNDYLVDFTSTFEIDCGGFVIYHTGDCRSLSKLNPVKRPDLWFVHPRCGLDVAASVKKFAPKTTVVAHLNELGHDKWRWSWQDGLAAKAAAEQAGGNACVPVWGERIV